MKCSAQILWKESYFTNLKLKLQINLIKPIEIAFSYDNFTFKWANTSCHPSPISHSVTGHGLWKLTSVLNGRNAMEYHGFCEITGFFNAPICIPNCLCPTLCIWMMLCYFCMSCWINLILIVRLCLKLFTQNVKLSVTKTQKRRGRWMHDIWQQHLCILPHPDQRVVPSSKTSRMIHEYILFYKLGIEN